MKFIWVLLGGAAGSLLRYIIAAAIPKSPQSSFFWGTLSVNLIGSFLIGILWAYFEKHVQYHNLKLFLIIGLLGGFTTFSSFALESMTLLREREIKSLLFYIFASNIGGISLAFLAYYYFKTLF